MVSYLIQTIACSGILYGYYHFFLRNEKFHQYNRFYLLFAMALSLLLPLLKIPVIVDDTNNNPIYNFVSTGEAVVVTAASKRFDYAQLLYILYGCVVLWMFSRLLKAISHIIHIKRSATSETIEDIRFIKTSYPDAPFSFFKWLFWHQDTRLESKEGMHMFKHEMYHIRSKHSRDLLFMEIIVSICWFNPFFYLYRKEVKTIQEFLADQHAASNSDTATYAELLLLRAIGARHQQLINPFFHNQLKRRITMLTSSKKPQYQWLRKLLVLPVAITAIALFAFTYKASGDKKNTETQTGQDNGFISNIRPANIIRVHNNPGAYVDTLKPQQRFFIDGKEVTEKQFKSLDTKKIKKMTVSSKNENGIQKVWVDLKPEGEIATAPNPIPAVDQKEIFTAVEKEAEYPGNWTSFLMRNLNSKIGIENGANPGKYEVQVSFVVDETGNVTDVKAISNNGYKMEEEAIRVIKKSGKWTPALQNGQAVSSYRKQSITFTNDAKMGASVNGASLTSETESSVIQKEAEVFTKVGTDAQYPGNWFSFLERNVNGQIPVDKGAGPGTYTTIVQFIVDTDGTVSNIKALTKHGFGMEEEAIKVIKKSGKWIPAIQNGREVKAYRKQPITFQINEIPAKKQSS